jgi:hypothetical protein
MGAGKSGRLAIIYGLGAYDIVPDKAKWLNKISYMMFMTMTNQSYY